MYEAITDGVRVRVEPTYLAEQSTPAERRFVWAYTVEIANFGAESLQLTARTWRITDAAGQIVEVHGEGVVGEQPRLDPGDAFTYTSGAPLSTPSGVMTGTYTMKRANGDTFEAAIPLFSLDSPHEPGARRPN